MADQLVFGILGPLQVGHRTTDPRRGNKRELVLAALLLEPNRPVDVERLVEAVWIRPPRSALANIQTYISGLRATLPPVEGGARIHTRRGGYQLSVDPGELDADVFEQLIAEAAQLSAASQSAAALTALDRALVLWRGQPLSDLPPVGWWQPRIDRITALRREATEARLRLRIALGQYARALTEIRLLLAEDPFQEDLWRDLLIALNANGRQAAALAAYRQARELMVSELGVEPGAALRRTHEAILRGERPAPDAAVSAGRWPVRQLPGHVGDLTARAGEIAALTARLRQVGTACPVAVVVGPSGVGKTTLAVHVGHLLAECFPDGQLYVDLNADGAHPPEPGEVLADVLRTLGVRGQDQPLRTGARAALYRSLLAGRRVLVVVDAATSAAQVAALIPGLPGCAVLVTSRWHLCHLPGAGELHLDQVRFDTQTPGQQGLRRWVQAGCRRL